MLVLDLVTDALRRIGIIAETEDPSAEQGADAVTRLNDLMFLLEGKGVDLGWNEKTATSNTVVLPRDVVHGIKAQLAELLAVDYGVECPARVVVDAEDSRRSLVSTALQQSFSRPNLRSAPLGETGGGVFDITTGTWT